jgi:hypothetical protein
LKIELVTRYVFTVVLFVLVGLGSRVTVGEAPSNALLRLSWSLVGEQVTRSLTAEELEKLPIHMRPQDGVIESTPVSYRLAVSIDGQSVEDGVIEAAGLKGDRPMYVVRDIPLELGQHDLDIVFEPAEPIEKAVRYRLEQQVDFQAGRITIVDLEPGRTELILR